jgi:hypothetical protein
MSGTLCATSTLGVVGCYFRAKEGRKAVLPKETVSQCHPEAKPKDLGRDSSRSLS